MTGWTQQELLSQIDNLKRSLDELGVTLKSSRLLVQDAHEQNAHLEEELGRRYRELESVKARCGELEQELDYQTDENRDLHRQRDQLMVELGDAVQSRLHAERRADEAESRSRRASEWRDY